MPTLFEVLKAANYDVKIKLSAITAIGDICLASEEGYESYID